ncbi:phage major tail tube protein, partial [Yersinia enterocolitica]
KLTIDGKVVMEIDVVNLIEIVNGVDLLEAQRKAIGR